MTFILFLRVLLRILTQAGLAIALVTAACTPQADEAAPPAPPPPIQPTPGLTEPPAPSPTVPPAASPTPAPCLQSEPTIVRSQVETRVLTKPLTVSVYLPPCFDSQPQEAYPVLYLLHGQSSDDRLWQRLGALHASDQLILSGETQPFLIVMPYEEYYLQSILESRFGEAVMETLLPWVEATYPVCRQRACRAIGGISRGATWSMRLGMEHWDTFAAIGAHSLPGSPFSAARLRTLLAAIPASSIPSLYLDTGTLDRYRRSAAEYHEMLERFSIPHQWHIFDGAHEETYWQAHIPDYLRWYARQWE